MQVHKPIEQSMTDRVLMKHDMWSIAERSSLKSDTCRCFRARLTTKACEERGKKEEAKGAIWRHYSPVRGMSDRSNLQPGICPSCLHWADEYRNKAVRFPHLLSDRDWTRVTLLNVQDSLLVYQHFLEAIAFIGCVFRKEIRGILMKENERRKYQNIERVST